MTERKPMSLAILAALMAWGCSSPEKQAAKAALQSTTVEPVAFHAMVCADDRAAMDVARFKSERAVPGSLWALVQDSQVKMKRTVKSATLVETKDAGEVIIAAVPLGAKGETVELLSTVQVRKDGETWCVVTGWAAETAAEAALEKVGEHITNWKLDDAVVSLDVALAQARTLPEGDARRTSIESEARSIRESLKIIKKDWIGGRWRVSQDKDPMTDEVKYLAILESVEGLPNVLGEMKPIHLVVRCVSNSLEVYITTDSMLDSDWRYDSVSARYRFGADPAEAVFGGISTDRQAMFLRDPHSWIARFRDHDGGEWRIELPIYGRSAATAKFNLNATLKAFESFPNTCK
jgi:hypothetical protein